MVQKRSGRRLAAILAADVVGYSRLMDTDEAGTLSRLKDFKRDVFDRITKAHGGRIFKTTGDGALVEFSSSLEAVRSAVEIQESLTLKNDGASPDQAITLRIGISLGDVIVEGADLYGNGINVAVRLEGLAEPGGICISGSVQEHVKHNVDFKLRDLGDCAVKNISDPVRVYSVSLKSSEADILKTAPRPEILFCQAPGGVQVAYTTFGEGPPVVIVSNWLTHLELDWALPARRAIIEALAKDHLVVRYDARGNGLSDWDVDDISFDASVSDLAAVIDVLALDRVSLVGSSQGAAISAAFAARNPGKVERLVLYGGYARGRRMRGSEGEVAESDAFITMIRQGWGKDIDAYVRMFGAFFMPDASAEQLAAFTDLQRKATPAQNAARFQLVFDSIDISKELANITAPTLVLHAREDARAPFEEGRRLAAAIPGARFSLLESRNHLLLPNEPAFKQYVDEITRFLRS